MLNDYVKVVVVIWDIKYFKNWWVGSYCVVVIIYLRFRYKMIERRELERDMEFSSFGKYLGIIDVFMGI